MPVIYEVLGFPASDKTDDVRASRRKGFCPFTGTVCDGGGNRYQSAINLKKSEHSDLADYFDNLDTIQSGVCSIQVKDGDNPWIVCPRRLFYLGKYADQKKFEEFTQHKLAELCGFAEGEVVGTWWEAKVKYSEELATGEDVDFDYTFDYVLMPLKKVSLDVAASESGLTPDETLKMAIDGGYSISEEGNRVFIDDFPSGSPTIVEVMTSSTSGGNKNKRTCIPQAFEDYFIKDGNHVAPGVNYRQVWARMASQMIVKSQAAVQWGGRTVWVLQNLLGDYVSSSTALNLKAFEATELSEVNILEYSYENDGDPKCKKGECLPLSRVTLYSGPIKPTAAYDTPSFQDIVLASVCPPKTVLVSALLKKGLANKYIYHSVPLSEN